jgi:glucose/arabinose dehydrogenase
VGQVGVIACLMCVACGGQSSPPPPVVTPPSGTETINGTERIGWEQRAGDTAELATIRYAIYVDGNRSELAGVTCEPTASATGFPCTARLPAMTPGGHGLEIASFVQDGSVLESARSATLRVTVTGQTAGGLAPPADAANAGSRAAGTDDSAPEWPAQATRLVDGLDRPTDLAALPDGRLLVAERSGRVRVVDAGVLVGDPALVVPGAAEDGAAVLALAVDPQFARTHAVYAIYTERSRRGGRTFTLARFREAGNTLGDRIALLDEIPASAEPHASLRFGPDAKLYAAFDDGGDAHAAADGASFNGKILRLNPDGTTPRDQPRGSPIVSEGLHSPRGLDWHRRSGRLWSADVQQVGAIRWTTRPASIAARENDLYVGSETGLVRARIDERDPARLAGTADVLRGVAVRAVAAAADGTIYFATDSALGSLRAQSEQR